MMAHFSGLTVLRAPQGSTHLFFFLANLMFTQVCWYVISELRGSHASLLHSATYTHKNVATVSLCSLIAVQQHVCFVLQFPVVCCCSSCFFFFFLWGLFCNDIFLYMHHPSVFGGILCFSVLLHWSYFFVLFLMLRCFPGLVCFAHLHALS